MNGMTTILLVQEIFDPKKVHPQYYLFMLDCGCVVEWPSKHEVGDWMMCFERDCVAKLTGGTE